VKAARDLAAALASYAAADDTERASLSRVRALLSQARDPFSRDVPDHVTASALVARPDGSAFLLVHHRRLDRWLQPGGHVEPEDRSVFDAARREAAEETGVTLVDAPIGPRILDVDVHPVPPRGKKPGHVHHDIRFLLTTTATNIAPAPSEVRDARWFTAEEALREGGDESVRRALRKAIALLPISRDER
jgi:8-oxo-dGTP pyrophosphatase MutT (NUDIX family)